MDVDFAEVERGCMVALEPFIGDVNTPDTVNAITKALGRVIGPGFRSCYVATRIGTVQFRFPRSKCKRIRRKWAKDRRNSKPDGRVRITGRTFQVPNGTWCAVDYASTCGDGTPVGVWAVPRHPINMTITI